LKRGENARSLELLSQLQKNILQLIRIAEENADNWFNMTKNLEKEISPENYEKFKKTTARLNELELYEAYKNSLLLVMELRNLVEKQYQLTISDDFLGKLFNYMNE
ncbi:TPA: lincosamide nucleotidyltransferase Lnu(B), partial [Escherichia coli]